MVLDLESRLKRQAQQLGFELVGIAPAIEADGFKQLSEWLERGYAGSMHYLHARQEARRHPRSILANVRSVIMVGMSYRQEQGQPPTARIAQYAVGHDYHFVLWAKLRELLAWLQVEHPKCQGRAVADSAPLMERDFARRAGLGWIGKNTLLLNRMNGSFLFLGALLVDIELKPDQSEEADHCGTCTACLEACPTSAFPQARVLDARRCISYLTIEHRGAVPLELRDGVGEWLFGCDVCQDVCPWNHKAPPGREPNFRARPEIEALDPQELLSITDKTFKERFAGTALLRAKRAGLLRNAAIVLGNRGLAEALPALRRAAGEDPDEIVREAAKWAIEKIRMQNARCEQSGSAFDDANGTHPRNFFG